MFSLRTFHKHLTVSSSILHGSSTATLTKPHGIISLLHGFSTTTTTTVTTEGGETKKRVTVVVGTHNGTFHCDEALACFLIRRTHKFSNARVLRTRDPQILETLDAVLYVGGIYDPIWHRFDHHQKGSTAFGHGFTTKLSSAGLVYNHFGAEIIAEELLLDHGHPDVNRLFLSVYKNFVEAFDATDNGINQYNTDQTLRYVNITSLSSRVGRLNLDWVDPDQSPQRQDEAFQCAIALAGTEFLESLHFHAKLWLPAWSIVMECLAAT